MVFLGFLGFFFFKLMFKMHFDYDFELHWVFFFFLSLYFHVSRYIFLCTLSGNKLRYIMIRIIKGKKKLFQVYCSLFYMLIVLHLYVGKSKCTSSIFPKISKRHELIFIGSLLRKKRKFLTTSFHFRIFGFQVLYYLL